MDLYHKDNNSNNKTFPFSTFTYFINWPKLVFGCKGTLDQEKVLDTQCLFTLILSDRGCVLCKYYSNRNQRKKYNFYKRVLLSFEIVLDRL